MKQPKLTYRFGRDNEAVPVREWSGLSGVPLEDFLSGIIKEHLERFSDLIVEQTAVRVYNADATLMLDVRCGADPVTCLIIDGFRNRAEFSVMASPGASYGGEKIELQPATLGYFIEVLNAYERGDDRWDAPIDQYVRVMLAGPRKWPARLKLFWQVWRARRNAEKLRRLSAGSRRGRCWSRS